MNKKEHPEMGRFRFQEGEEVFDLSIVGGENLYSTPRENNLNFDEYEEVEIAVLKRRVEDGVKSPYEVAFVRETGREEVDDLLKGLVDYDVGAYVPTKKVEKLFHLMVEQFGPPEKVR